MGSCGSAQISPDEPAGYGLPLGSEGSGEEKQFVERVLASRRYFVDTESVRPISAVDTKRRQLARRQDLSRTTSNGAADRPKSACDIKAYLEGDLDDVYDKKADEMMEKVKEVKHVSFIVEEDVFEESEACLPYEYQWAEPEPEGIVRNPLFAV